MVTMNKTLGVLGLVAAMSVSAFAVSNISSTKHNLSSTGTGTLKANAGENGNEICIYCHTPHAANTAFNGAPLWNKKSPTGTFFLYGAATAGTAGTTLAGTATTGTTPNSPSMACLSCHDGASAINSIVNTSGSGVNADTTNYLTTFAGAGTATTIGTGVTNIGTDLRNDHPISLNYTEGKAGLRLKTTNLQVASGVIWAGATTVGDLLRGVTGTVECGSCHDPHEQTNATFLRASNASSALCIGCHQK